MKMTLSAFAQMIAFVAAFATQLAQAKTHYLPFDSSKQRVAIIELPAAWTVMHESSMTYYLSNSSLEAMRFLITVIPLPERRRSNVPMKQIAQEQAMQLASSSEVPTLPVRDFRANGSRGAYFDAVDKAPKPGEFKYLRQFLFEQNGAIVTVTILSNKGHDKINAFGLKVLRSFRVIESAKE
jgi:hypothetical protein